MFLPPLFMLHISSNQNAIKRTGSVSIIINYTLPGHRSGYLHMPWWSVMYVYTYMVLIQDGSTEHVTLV